MVLGCFHPGSRGRDSPVRVLTLTGGREAPRLLRLWFQPRHYRASGFFHPSPIKALCWDGLRSSCPGSDVQGCTGNAAPSAAGSLGTLLIRTLLGCRGFVILPALPHGAVRP